MATIGSMCLEALQMLGQYDAQTPMTAEDGALALTVCNDMLDSWSNESLTTFTILEQSAVLVPGQQSYTIGQGGNFNMTRPIRIIEGPGSAYVQDGNGNNYQMEVVPRDKWNLYANRSNIVQSDFPNILFYDPQFPLGVINVLPYPNAAYTMFWDSYLQLSDFANLQTEVTLPPGYALAIKTNLAVALKPYFDDAQLDPIVLARAMESKGNIKRSNMRPVVALYDAEIVSRAGVSYNPYTDTVGSVVGVS
jgi:hypothetical protein